MLDPVVPSSPAAKNTHTSRRALLLAVPLLAAALAVGAGLVALPAAPAVAATAGTARVLQTPIHAPQRYVIRTVAHVAKLPVTLPATPPAAPAAASVAAGPDWTISIATVGLQAEVDQCQWVRMDFTADVPLPIVAAHNFCGGGIVLEMLAGQTVSLSGTGLDGNYVVVGSKDAWADQDATEALSGLSGDVVLQTCYWDNNGHLMLVALQRVS